jgi:hypothetical protein
MTQIVFGARRAAIIAPIGALLRPAGSESTDRLVLLVLDRHLVVGGPEGPEALAKTLFVCHATTPS